MKKVSRLARTIHKRPQLRQDKPTPSSGGGRKSQTSRWRWPVIALVVLLSAGGTWAAFEFFIWNNVPPELIGKWVVEGGPQDGATFDFSRKGNLEAHLNNNGVKHVLKGTVKVEDKTLFITTQNPNTKQDETRSCTIRELTDKSLIVEFEKGEVFKMTRAK